MTILSFITKSFGNLKFGVFILIFHFLFFLPFQSKAQFTEKVMPYQEYRLAEKTITDSLQVAEQNLKQGKVASANRTATYMLKTYPFIPAQKVRAFYSDDLIVEPLRGYPTNAYAVRAKAREASGDYKGAESDITAALRHLNQRYFTYGESTELINAREYYEIRARLRYKYLRNQQGGCADLGVLYKLDSVKAASLGYKDCAIPKLKFVTSAQDYQIAQKAALDSLLLAENALHQNQHAQALRLLNNLISGRVSHYEKFMVRIEHSALKVKLPGQLYGMRAEAKQGVGDYKGAKADLDTAISRMNYRCFFPGDGLWRYQRGLLLIDHLNDKEGGCTDLARAYQCDTTITGPDHSKWRDCMLPAHKRIMSQQEHAESNNFLEQVSIQIDTLLNQKQYDQALLITTNIIAGRVGRFDNVWKNHPKPELKGFIHYRRSKALQGLLRYPEALAELDTAIKFTQSNRNNGWMFCQRGILKLDILKDSTGCDDLRSCYLRGYLPKDKNWRNCKFEERTTSYRFRDRYLDPVFGELDSWDLQLSVFRQGKTGFSAGTYLSPGDWLANYGPSFGVDVMSGYQSKLPVVAPKIGIEGSLLLGAARIDLAYYGYKGVHDLRLTPQAGLSLLGFMNFMYGYSIPLRSEEQPFLTRNRFSLYINFVEASKIGG